MDHSPDPTPVDLAGTEAPERTSDRPSDDDGPSRAGAPVASPAAARRSWSAGDLVGVVIAAAGGAAIVLTMLVPRAGTHDASATTVMARKSVQAATLPPSARAVPPAVVPRTGWHPANEWVGSRKKSVAFELAAARPVRVWMRQVTPVLVVRCLGGSLDAFVVTESPSSIEPGRNDHTVRLVFDGHEHVEHWADSAGHDGLFAPDGDAFLSRLSRAQSLTVGFAPHNTPSAEAAFEVSGAADLVGPLKKYCR